MKTETLFSLSCQALKLGIRSSSEHLFLESITAVSNQGAAQTYLFYTKDGKMFRFILSGKEFAPIGETDLNKQGVLLLQCSTDMNFHVLNEFSCLNGEHVCLI